MRRDSITILIDYLQNVNASHRRPSDNLFDPGNITGFGNHEISWEENANEQYWDKPRYNAPRCREENVENNNGYGVNHDNLFFQVASYHESV